MPHPADYEAGPAEQRYKRYAKDRQPYLDRAKEVAKYTLPTLFKHVNQSGTTQTSSSELSTPWQSVGAAGLNNLTSKLMMTLFPTDRPFFRETIDQFVFDKEALEENLNPDEAADLKKSLEDALRQREEAVLGEFNARRMRPALHYALMHILAAGNVMIYIPEGGGMKAIPLDRYVTKLDPVGNHVESIMVEAIHPQALPKEIREFLTNRGALKDDDQKETPVEVYTHVKREGDFWVSYQEARGHLLPDSKGKHPIDRPAYMPQRGLYIDGEDYGRGYIEMFLGDLKTLDGLSQAIAEGSYIAAKTLFGCDPGAMTKPQELAKLNNGEFFVGKEAHYWTLRVDKGSDYATAERLHARLTEQLSQQLLLESGFRRQAERVTAEEIRFVAQQLEDALGGLYSVLTEGLQLPIAKRLQAVLEKDNRLSKLDSGKSGLIRPVIVTGLEALGRSHDAQRQFDVTNVALKLLPELAQEFDLRKWHESFASKSGEDVKSYMKSAEQRQAEAQQQNSQQLLESAPAKELTKAAAPQIAQQLAQQAQQQ